MSLLTSRLVRANSSVFTFVVTPGNWSGRDPQRHHHLFKSRVPCTLAETVHADLDLSRAHLHSRQRVRGSETEIIVTVRGKHVVTGHLATDVLDQRAEVPRDAVTDCVGDVEGGRPRLDTRDEDLQHEVERRPRGVLRAELHVVGVLAGTAHAISRLGEDLLAGHLQHVLHVLRARRDEDVDPSLRRILERIPAPIHI